MSTDTKIHWNQQLTWDQRKLLKQMELTREFPKYLLKVPWGDESLDCDLSSSRQLPLSWGRVLCPVSSGCQQLTFCFQFTRPRRSCHSRLFPLKSCDFFPAELPCSSHLKFHFISVGKLNVTHSEPYSLTQSTPVLFQPLVFSFFLFFYFFFYFVLSKGCSDVRYPTQQTIKYLSKHDRGMLYTFINIPKLRGPWNHCNFFLTWHNNKRVLSFHGFFCFETQCNRLVAPQNKILCDELHCKMMTPATWKQSTETTETEEMCLFCLLVNFSCNTNRQKLDFQAAPGIILSEEISGSGNRHTNKQSTKRKSPSVPVTVSVCNKAEGFPQSACGGNSLSNSRYIICIFFLFDSSEVTHLQFFYTQNSMGQNERLFLHFGSFWMPLSQRWSL